MFEMSFQQYFTKEQTEKLHAVHIGIGGVGGLGSNVAMLLARCGVRHFVFIDCDTVEPSNLNRQQYFLRHIGMRKVDALERILHELDHDIVIEKYCLTLMQESMHFTLAPLLHKAHYWAEGFDDAIMKRLFVENAIKHERFIVSASGFGGFGGPPMQIKHMGEHLVLVGDFVTDEKMAPPLAPRTTQAAAMQADILLTKILNED